LIVGFGPSYNDTTFTSYNQGGNVTYTLGFNLPYQNSLYNTITVSVNGFVLLNGTELISAYANLFCTNNSGAVYARTANATDYPAITNKILSVYSNYTQFTTSSAFVVTWF
jgi:hypothetical protein